MARITTSIWLIVLIALVAANGVPSRSDRYGFSRTMGWPLEAVEIDDGPVLMSAGNAGVAKLFQGATDPRNFKASWDGGWIVWDSPIDSVSRILITPLHLMFNLSLATGICLLLFRALAHWGTVFRKCTIVDLLLVTGYVAILCAVFREGPSASSGWRTAAIVGPVFLAVGLIGYRWMSDPPEQHLPLHAGVAMIALVACAAGNVPPRLERFEVPDSEFGKTVMFDDLKEYDRVGWPLPWMETERPITMGNHDSWLFPVISTNLPTVPFLSLGRYHELQQVTRPVTLTSHPESGGTRSVNLAFIVVDLTLAIVLVAAAIRELRSCGYRKICTPLSLLTVLAYAIAVASMRWKDPGVWRTDYLLLVTWPQWVALAGLAFVACQKTWLWGRRSRLQVASAPGCALKEAPIRSRET